MYLYNSNANNRLISIVKGGNIDYSGAVKTVLCTFRFNVYCASEV